MKNSLSLLAIMAMASSLAACSDDGGDGNGTGGVPSQTGGTPGTGGATGGTGTGGSGVGGATGGAGTGGSGAVGATGGSGAAGATGGVGGGVGNSIAIDGSWVDMTGNTVGIQGAFFILEDGVKDGVALDDGVVHTDFTADTGAVEEDGVSKFSDDTLMPCISGTAAKVLSAEGTECDADGSPVMCNWEAHWGGGLGLTLNETGEGENGEESVKSPFNADAAGIKGFQFTVSGEVAGATVRFKATDVPNDGEDFCAAITINEPNVQVTFEELKHMCWGSDGTLALDTTQLMQLQWQIVTDPSGDFPVENFCVENLAWLSE